MFDSHIYLSHLSEDLIRLFSRAGDATTPALIGGARENSLREKLEQLLPSFVGVTTGCVIDSFNSTSKQTDVILYENNICPVFSVNNTPEATYVPCEGVIAVGEVKSGMGTKELNDSIIKIRSVKELKRFSSNKLLWRKYGGLQSIHGTESERYNQDEKWTDQVYGFILCQKITLKIDTFLDKLSTICSTENAKYLPNIIISLEDGIFVYIDKLNNKVTESKFGATDIYHIKHPEGEFQYLLNKLQRACVTGRSTDSPPFSRYVLKNSSLPSNGKYTKIT